MGNKNSKNNDVAQAAHTSDQESNPETEQLKKSLRHMPSAVYIVQDQKLCFVNQKFEEMTGYSEEELIGTYAMELVLPADRTAVKKKAVTMLRGERTSPYEHSFFTKNGDSRRAIQTLSSIDYRGRRATLGSCMDVTELLQIKESLRSSKDRFYDVFRSSPDGVVVCALEDGFYIDVNEAFLTLTEYQREEVIGRTDGELKIWSGKQGRGEMVKTLLENGNIHDLEITFRTKSRKNRTILWSAELIDFGGEKCLVGVAHDITERKHAEEKRLELEKQKGPATLVTQLGLTMVGSILFCFAIGYYLDKWLGTKGLFITIFIVLGVIGGGYTVYRQIMETIDFPEKEKQRDE